MTVSYMTTPQGYVGLTTSGATTGPVLPIGSFSYGSIFVPAGETLVTLTFWVGTSPTATFLQPYDGLTAITLTVAAGRAYRLPSDLFAFPFLRIQVNAAVVVAGGLPIAFGW